MQRGSENVSKYLSLKNYNDTWRYRQIKISITDSAGNPYIPVEGDKIRFAAKKAYTDDAPCIIKEIPFDTCVLQLDPEDTKNLEQPSEYVYDIQITLTDGTVDTFIRGVLEITEEVD